MLLTAFDKINNSVRDLKNNIAEGRDQKQRIANLTKEVERLRVENKEKKRKKRNVRTVRIYP